MAKAYDKNNLHKRQRLEHLRNQLDNERSTFTAHWRDLSDFVLPRRSRFFLADVNQGNRRNEKIIDSTATLAANTLSSGMMSGITSPSRPWFRLAFAEPALNEIPSVKLWLHTVQQRMSTVFLRSNLYNALPNVYKDLGVFGTSALLIEEDFDDVMKFYSFPIGSYMIANDDKLRVRVFYREFRMTVRQIVNKFGQIDPESGEIDWSNIATQTKALWENGNTEAWVDVNHVIMPNPDWDPNLMGSKYKKFRSLYFERGYSGNKTQGSYLVGIDEGKFLRESGYDYFPVLAPRWEVTGEDVYATNCPGMVALGDVKQLQTMEKRGLQAIEKMVNPPMIAPTHLQYKKTSILPGDITYSDEKDGFRPAHEINFRVDILEQKQQQVRQRISRAFYEDLFLMLAQSDRRQITAREIEERHEEKLLALGPVLEQLNQDLLNPLIDIAFDIMLRQELVPEPPEEIQGEEMKVEYISVMAQAQKLVGLGSIERFTGYVGQVAQYDPSVLKKVNAAQLVDEYADITSMPPGIVRSDDELAELEAQEQEAVARQQELEMAQQAASTAKTMSETEIDPMSNENALQAMIGR